VPPVKLPKLRQDLKLYPGPQHRDGSPSWRVLDPVRNRFYEIGLLEFELLARWADHPSVAALIDAVIDETPISPTEEEVEGFIAFLVNNQLVVPEGGEALGQLRRRWISAKRPWYEQLFHSYLFFRIPLVRPDKFLERTLPIVQLFYTRAFALIVLMVFLADIYLLTREWDELARTFRYFFNLQGGFYFLLAGSFSKVVHELAHAYTAKRYGVRVPAMGVSFLVMWPFLYTDTSETWKLADRKKQIAIASAGVIAELALACFATLLWVITPEGAMKSIFFILATTTWLMTLAVNASPFMRFDGYFVLSDFLDFPNLHDRSFACARWWVRRQFFGLREALPEPTFSNTQRRGLVIFALFIWVYRLVVYFGIALLVYHAFFKLLGIVLMLLEFGFFIIRPVVSELRYVLARRSLVHLNRGAIASLIGVLLVALWLVPVANEVTAPAVMVAEREQSVFVPMSAQIQSVEVMPGQRVEAGQVLVRLRSAELLLREKSARRSLATARLEHLRAAATRAQQERMMVLDSQVAEAEAELNAVAEEQSKLEVRASAPGIVRDMRSDLVAGRWIGPRELMMRIVSPGAAGVEAFVTDSQIEAVEIGQLVKFIPEVAGMSAVAGRVVAIDKTASKQITRSILAGPYGGGIPAVTDRRGGATAQNAVYRVVIRPDAIFSSGDSIVRGTVRIQTDLTLIAQNFIYRAASIFVRESGF
jgi:putative peptide zinc metalloprotease protein